MLLVFNAFMALRLSTRIYILSKAIQKLLKILCEKFVHIFFGVLWFFRIILSVLIIELFSKW